MRAMLRVLYLGNRGDDAVRRDRLRDGVGGHALRRGYGNFDIILDHFSRISQLRLTIHVSCATLYLVPVLTGC